ncbi:unnamed protein product [Prorocentrum cordatum]|uniref:Uncharacterized protein n=1 Tax=Prorocentrum cordatum TaxID=2364126 RepID=A0ABN9U7W8_9DINO|nr:unnamed protein product [Polarella glacialis]
MGGFGALLHGGELADAVLAFGPQSRLDQAILRPAAATPGRLDELTCAVQDAVRLGRRRGARLEVHCAADEHFWHGLNLPLEDGALTVHPICPRKPFGRLLDSGGVLAPIVADELLLALWGAGGLAARLRTPRAEVLGFFFGGEAAEVPRPGDWFCPRCSRRNMGTRFFSAAATGARCRRVGGGARGPEGAGGAELPAGRRLGLRGLRIRPVRVPAHVPEVQGGEGLRAWLQAFKPTTWRSVAPP